MDIIVTTPLRSIKDAAKEAEEAKQNPGSMYFRKLSTWPKVSAGDRIYYVEENYIRGYCIVEAITTQPQRVCDTTGKDWGSGIYIFMQADTWQWIKPIAMVGFRGWRYANKYFKKDTVEVIGDYMDPKPTFQKVKK